MKNRLTILSLLVLIPIVIAAQTDSSYENFKKSMQSAFNSFKSDKQAEYDAYRKKINDEYADFMSRSWNSFKAKQAVKPVEEPKVEPVKYEPKPKKEEQPAPQPKPKEKEQPAPQQKPIPVKKDTIVIPAPQPAPQPIAPVVEPEDQSVVRTELNFYGSQVSIKFPKDDSFKLKSLKNKDLSDAWRQLSDSKYDVLLSSALDARKKLNLCDWAYMNLLRQAAEKKYGKGNDAIFVQAFLMVQSGYNVRMAKTDGSNRLYMLVASQYDIFGMNYYVLNNVKYYAVDSGESSLSICEAGFEKEKLLSLQIANQQNFGKDMTEKRKLTSKRGLTAAVSVNKNSIDFFNTYPSSCINGDFTTKWAAYANTPLEKDVRDALYPQLQRSVQGMSERDAVNLILNWVQTAFVYGYDDEIWGGDRAFFGEETLYYPYCDCEDRSILFSRLVRDILHLDVVLLYYPGHLATAVHFNDDVEGDYLLCRNKRYVVCDPTYIGAPVGLTMPQMNNKEAKIIILGK